MSPPNPPARPAAPRPPNPRRDGRLPELELDLEPEQGSSPLSPTKHVQPSLLELEDLLEQPQPEPIRAQAEPPLLAVDGELPVDSKTGAAAWVPSTGDVIGGTYRVEGELGSGAMG